MYPQSTNVTFEKKNVSETFAFAVSSGTKDHFHCYRVVINVDVEEQNKIGRFVTSDKQK
jgi:hypothetical protein